MVEYSNKCKKKKNQSSIYPLPCWYDWGPANIDLLGDATELYYKQRPMKGIVEILGLGKLW